MNKFKQNQIFNLKKPKNNKKPRKSTLIIGQLPFKKKYKKPLVRSHSTRRNRKRSDASVDLPVNLRLVTTSTFNVNDIHDITTSTTGSRHHNQASNANDIHDINAGFVSQLSFKDLNASSSSRSNINSPSQSIQNINTTRDDHECDDLHMSDLDLCCHETDLSEFITTLQTAIDESEYTDYKISDDDQLIHEQLSSGNVSVYIAANDWLVFAEFSNQTVQHDKLINVVKRTNTWQCDRNCITYNRDKFSNILSAESETPLCIHGMLSHLITECDNPTNIPVRYLGENDIVSHDPLIYFIKAPNHGQKRWLFAMDRLKSKLILWVNHSGTIKCSQHYNQPNIPSKSGSGCYCSRQLDCALKKTCDSEEYDIIRAGGDYQRFIETGSASFNPLLLYSKETVPVPPSILTKFDANQDSEKSKQYYSFEHPTSMPDILYPERLSCCGIQVNASQFKSQKATFYDVHKSQDVIVKYWICGECGTEHHLDGLQMHLFNYHDKEIVSHDLIMDVAMYLCSGKCKTFNGYATQAAHRYTNRGGYKFLRVDQLISLWHHCIVKFEFFDEPGCLLCDPQKTNVYKILLIAG
eukprot:9495_1